MQNGLLSALSPFQPFTRLKEVPKKADIRLCLADVRLGVGS